MSFFPDLFYLITKKAGAKISLLWKLIFASLVMLVTGYFGETIDRANSVMWGVISGAAYFYIVYLIWFGEVAKLAQSAGPQVAKATKILAWFVLVGWAIYPLGYILGTPGGLFGIQLVTDPAAAATWSWVNSAICNVLASAINSDKKRDNCGPP